MSNIEPTSTSIIVWSKITEASNKDIIPYVALEPLKQRRVSAALLTNYAIIFAYGVSWEKQSHFPNDDIQKLLTTSVNTPILETRRTCVRFRQRAQLRNSVGQAKRTTKVLLNLARRDKGGANTGKRAYLDETAQVLNAGRRFYLEFFLAHAEIFKETVVFYSKKHLEMRERPISSHELLTWAEAATVATPDHPHPWEGWNFTEQFPEMPFVYRRSLIQDAIGKVRSYLSHLANWEKTKTKKGRPGLPGASNHPTLYQGTLMLDLEQLNTKDHFIQLKVYTSARWEWHNYPVQASRYFEQRIKEASWERESPKLVLRNKSAELHVPQTKTIAAKKVVESKQDPDLVTVGVDLNVKNLAVLTVRQHGEIIETVFVRDHGAGPGRATGISKRSARNSSFLANRSKGNTAISNCGHMSGG